MSTVSSLGHDPVTKYSSRREGERAVPVTRARATARAAAWEEARASLTTPHSQTQCTGAPGRGRATSPTPPTAIPPRPLTPTGPTGTTSPPSPTTFRQPAVVKQDLKLYIFELNIFVNIIY